MTNEIERRDSTGHRHWGAMAIVHRYVLISAGAGLITPPVLDVWVLAGVHIALIKAIVEYYGGEFSDHAARNVLLAIGASLIPGSFGSILGRRALRALPFVTPAMRIVSTSAFSAFVSYGLGRLVVEHFETGGTLQTFDVERLHRTFSRS